jgi:competence protein ComEA
MKPESAVQVTAEAQRRRVKQAGDEPGCTWVKCRKLELIEVPTTGRSPRTLSASQSRRGGFAATFSVMIRVILFLLFSANLWAELPEGPGRTETERLCQNCHDLARAVSRRQDRDGWQTTLNKMVALGTKGTDQEFALILDYLAKNFPAEELPPVNVNQAAAIELESRLSLRRSQAAAIIAYRTKNGKFKSIEELKQVPGVDVEKIEAKRDRIVF